MFASKLTALVVAVAALGQLSALGGTAAANGGSGSATVCPATSKKVVDGRFLVNLTMSDVDPSQRGFATCAYARKVARHVTAMELDAPRVVAGFSCTTFVFKRKPPIRAYRCGFQSGDAATEIGLSFRVSYVKDELPRDRAGGAR